MALPEIKVRVSADTDQAITGLRNVGGAVDGVATKSATATSNTGKMSSALKGLSNVSGSTRAKIQNVSFQLQDMAVQLQGGTRASVALSQQLPQLLGGFGAVGAAVGVLAGVGIPAIAFAFSGLVGDAEDVATSLDELQDALADYQRSADLASLSAEKLSDRFGSQSEAIRETLTILQNIALVKTIDSLNVALAQVDTTNLRELVSLADSFASEFGTSSADFQLTLERIQSEYGLTIDQARELLSALQDMSDARGPEDVATSARALNELLLEVFGSTQEIPPVFLEMANAAGQVDVAASSIIGTMEAVEAATAGAADAMSRLKHAADPLDAFGGAGSFVPTDAPAWGDQVKSPSSGGGAGTNSRLDSLLSELQTEREALEEWRIESLELLAEANAAELEVLGGHAEAKLRLEKEYQDRLKDVKGKGNKDALSGVLKGGADILGAMGAVNEKALKISQTFAAAEAFISTMKGAAKELEKGTFGFATAAAVIAKGTAFVAAIEGVSASSAGASTSAGSAATSTAEAAAPVQRRVAEFQIEGTNVRGLQELADDINEMQRQGYIIEIVGR